MMEQALERADQASLKAVIVFMTCASQLTRATICHRRCRHLRWELAQTATTLISVTVEGTPRRLHPVVREETYRIGAEALANAVRHALATQVDTEITYSRKDSDVAGR